MGTKCNICGTWLCLLLLWIVKLLGRNPLSAQLFVCQTDRSLQLVPTCKTDVVVRCYRPAEVVVTADKEAIVRARIEKSGDAVANDERRRDN